MKYFTLLLKEDKFSSLFEGLQWHINNQIPLFENIYRPNSKNYFKLLNEARKLYQSGNLIVHNELDEWALQSDIGLIGVFEGKKVLLDFPIIENDSIEALKLFNLALRQMPGSKKQKETISKLNKVRKKLGLTPIQEADYKGKSVELNKPTRSSGPKKYKVYVKNESGNVIKVNFGDVKGGLNAKINDPAARKAFASRHDCKNKTDKTKPGYWACRLPYYWKNLGGNKNMNTYW